MTLQELFDECGFDTMSYSGRGMYGKKCLAVQVRCGQGEFIAAILRAVIDCGPDNSDLDEISEAFDGMQQDSLGKGSVFYFPGVEFQDDDEEEEEEL